jgi:hypothetical protein
MPTRKRLLRFGAVYADSSTRVEAANIARRFAHPAATPNAESIRASVSNAG